MFVNQTTYKTREMDSCNGIEHRRIVQGGIFRKPEDSKSFDLLINFRNWWQRLCNGSGGGVVQSEVQMKLVRGSRDFNRRDDDKKLGWAGFELGLGCWVSSYDVKSQFSFDVVLLLVNPTLLGTFFKNKEVVWFKGTNLFKATSQVQILNLIENY